MKAYPTTRANIYIKAQTEKQARIIAQHFKLTLAGE